MSTKVDILSLLKPSYSFPAPILVYNSRYLFFFLNEIRKCLNLKSTTVDIYSFLKHLMAHWN